MARTETIAEGVDLYLGDCREILPTIRANHPEIVAMEARTRRFVEEFRGQSSADLDLLHQKENEIARLLVENNRLRRAYLAAIGVKPMP